MTAHHDQHDQPSSFHPSNCHQLAPIWSRNFRDMILIRQYHALLGTNIPPKPRRFWRWFSFSPGGICSFPEGYFFNGVCFNHELYIILWPLGKNTWEPNLMRTENSSRPTILRLSFQWLHRLLLCVCDERLHHDEGAVVARHYHDGWGAQPYALDVCYIFCI